MRVCNTTRGPGQGRKTVRGIRRPEGFSLVELIITLAVGVTCRINTRRPAEKIHRQPGVVGQCRQARDTRGIARFKNRVFNERQAGFFRFNAAEFSNRAQLHRLAEHGLKFFEFAGVVAGQYQLREVDH